MVGDGVWFGPVAGPAHDDDFPAILADTGGAIAGLVDLDHDGVDNLLVSDCCGEFSVNDLWVADDPVDRDGFAALGAEVAGGGQRFITRGDVTGDGWPDLAVARFAHYDDPVVRDNPVWVLACAASGAIEDLAWATFAPADDLDIAVAGAVGDFDGDGVGDLAIGWTDGRVWVFAGPLGRGVLTDADADAVLIGDVDPVPIEVGAYTGVGTADGFGERLVAGDFDGDGRDDLAVGAPRAAGAGTLAGRVDVWWGAGL